MALAGSVEFIVYQTVPRVARLVVEVKSDLNKSRCA